MAPHSVALGTVGGISSPPPSVPIPTAAMTTGVVDPPHFKQVNSRHAYVTLLSADGYLPGVLALYRSLRQAGAID